MNCRISDLVAQLQMKEIYGVVNLASEELKHMNFEVLEN